MENQIKKEKTRTLVETLLSKRWKPSSALPIVIFVAVLVILISLIGLRAVLAKRSAAQAMLKLKEIDDARLRALSDAKVAANEEARKQAEERLEKLNVQLSTIAGQISSRREDHAKYIQSLRSVTSWDDVMVVR